MNYRWVLLATALFGLLVPNDMFLYATLHGADGCGAVSHNLLASSFLVDAFVAVGVLGWFFAVRPIGRVKWYWFVGMSLLGGLAFSLPFYWWLNSGRNAGSDRKAL